MTLFGDLHVPKTRHAVNCPVCAATTTKQTEQKQKEQLLRFATEGRQSRLRRPHCSVFNSDFL